ncbi:hypothetical protein TEA_001382 [Camellia sinensis var. sinensis]|uniref:Uncharacterized protein n=1 Tax=Camellia sinensis var. sinensis TaxID=542762 RepID=A0A4S4DE86_CAMSN|nr:hypothetical protein TEA_001382 [Camellia sinensis var. sinensis]
MRDEAPVSVEWLNHEQSNGSKSEPRTMSRCIGEFSFRSEVRAVKLRRDRTVVVLEHKIYVYNFMGLKLLHQIETLANPRGLCCLSQNLNTSVLACPGQVRIEHFGLNMTKLKNARDSQIACLNLTMDGLLLATASTKGTLIRIFNTIDGTKLQEPQTGCGRGLIYLFDCCSNPAMVSHNSSSLDALISPSISANPSSSLSFMKGVLPKYFSSEWSFAQFHLQNTPNSLQHLDLRTLSLLLAWLGVCHLEESVICPSLEELDHDVDDVESIVERFLKLSSTMCVCVFVHSMVTINLMVKHCSKPVVDAFDPSLLVAPAISHTINFTSIKDIRIQSQDEEGFELMHQPLQNVDIEYIE